MSNSYLHNLKHDVKKQELDNQRLDTTDSDFRFCIELVQNLLVNLKEDRDKK